jgi:hypothetical protein
MKESSPSGDDCMRRILSGFWVGRADVEVKFIWWWGEGREEEGGITQQQLQPTRLRGGSCGRDGGRSGHPIQVPGSDRGLVPRHIGLVVSAGSSLFYSRVPLKYLHDCLHDPGIVLYLEDVYDSGCPGGVGAFPIPFRYGT